MSWGIRKSLIGSFSRLNLSKSGLGVSGGLRGLRLGTGPGGPYLAAGLKGLFVRHKLTGSGNNGAKPDPEEAMSTGAAFVYIIIVMVGAVSTFAIVTFTLIWLFGQAEF